VKAPCCCVGAAARALHTRGGAAESRCRTALLPHMQHMPCIHYTAQEAPPLLFPLGFVFVLRHPPLMFGRNTRAAQKGMPSVPPARAPPAPCALSPPCTHPVRQSSAPILRRRLLIALLIGPENCMSHA